VREPAQRISRAPIRAVLIESAFKRSAKYVLWKKKLHRAGHAHCRVDRTHCDNPRNDFYFPRARNCNATKLLKLPDLYGFFA
jgi:hypothetical protein